MPFVPYLSLTPKQQLDCRTRPSDTHRAARDIDRPIGQEPQGPLIRLDADTPEHIYHHYAFWVRPDGSIAPYGMKALPILEHRDGHQYVPEDDDVRGGISKSEHRARTLAGLEAHKQMRRRQPIALRRASI